MPKKLNHKKEYTFEELEELTLEDLQRVKHAKQQLLYEAKQDKLMMVSNILSLQGMIKEANK